MTPDYVRLSPDTSTQIGVAAENNSAYKILQYAVLWYRSVAKVGLPKRRKPAR
jgi:hypothetical protein